MRLPSHLLLLVALALPVAARAQDTTRVQTIDVPSLIGMTPASARAVLARYNLALGSVNVTYTSADAGAGTIVSQKPSAGTAVPRGSSVSVVVREYRAQPRDTQTTPAAETTVDVPNIVGQSVEAARRLLAARDLLLGSAGERESSAVAPGRIFTQKPGAGTAVKPGSTVDVLVARAAGPPPVDTQRPPVDTPRNTVDSVNVPNLLDRTTQDAAALLRQAGLTLGAVDFVRSANATGSGRIVQQRPGPDRRVPAGTSVAVGVRAYQPAAPDTPASPEPDSTIAVPAVTTRTVNDARAILQRATLTLGTVAQSDAAAGAPGAIATQTPAAGLRVRPGTAVNVIVATDSTLVPALNGRSVDDARAVLRQSSLSLGTVRGRTSTAAGNTVIAQQPQARTRVRRGTAVAVTISQPAGAPPVDSPGQPTPDTTRPVTPVDPTRTPADTTRTPRDTTRTGRDSVPPAAEQQAQDTGTVIYPPADAGTPPARRGFPWAIPGVGALLGALLLGAALRARGTKRMAKPQSTHVPAPKPMPRQPVNMQGMSFQPGPDMGTTLLDRPADLTDNNPIEFVGDLNLGDYSTSLAYVSVMTESEKHER